MCDVFNLHIAWSYLGIRPQISIQSFPNKPQVWWHWTCKINMKCLYFLKSPDGVLILWPVTDDDSVRIPSDVTGMYD